MAELRTRPAHSVRSCFFSNGEFTAPSGTENIVVRNPADGTEVGQTPRGGEREVDHAVSAARRSFDSGPWPRLSPAERGEWLDKLADELERRGDDIAAMITAEIGQPIRVSTAWGGKRPVAHLRYYAQVARDLQNELERPNAARKGTSTIRREPLGVAALIVPWNHPFASTTLKLGPALAAGCTVVIKPAEESPLDIYILAEACLTIGLPAGVINIVPGGRETGQILVAHPGIDKVGFTGSTAAGRSIASTMGERLLPVTLELGGKSAAIVLKSADLDMTMDSLRVASFENTGQTCASMSRVLVPQSRYAEVRDRLLAEMSGLRVGDPWDPETDLGPLVSTRIKDRALGLVHRAEESGVTVTRTHQDLPRTGCFVSPVLIENAAMDSEIAQTEVFGPVVSLHSYGSVEEAIDLANQSQYGLASAIFGDSAKAESVARRIQAGTVGINGYKPDLNHPYGGYKASGMGREFALEAVEAYQNTKTIWR
ncbi:aldehyde dehydrogenase family protein [Citricoccus zhacaiensis]|uniref:aldehyde dehydrogenase family protein n=1 Tax=Citricoccus zhacaiensis TaxID=489142 RepID=UPI00166DCA48|nr:aldehyde dehydrogenase family protein [Citricoccus zhacaiensis]